MTATRKILTLTLAGVLCVSATPLLVSCSPQQALQGVVSNAVKDASGIDVTLGGTTMPEEFPAEVPVIAGEIATGGSLGTSENKSWSVVIKVADLAAAFDEATGKLLAAGFTTDFDASAAGASTGVFSSAKYSVMLAATAIGSEKNVSYVVTQVVTQ
jgi:hypothetical protein